DEWLWLRIACRIKLSGPCSGFRLNHDGDGLPTCKSAQLKTVAQPPADKQAVVTVRSDQCAIQSVVRDPELGDGRVVNFVHTLKVNLIISYRSLAGRIVCKFGDRRCGKLERLGAVRPNPQVITDEFFPVPTRANFCTVFREAKHDRLIVPGDFRNRRLLMTD